MTELSTQQIYLLLDLELDTVMASESVVFTGIATLDQATPAHLTFLHTRDYIESARMTKAGACLVLPELAKELPQTTTAIISTTPYEDFVRVALEFAPTVEPASIHPSALIDPSVIIDHTCSIGAYCILGKGVVLGKDCRIGSHCVIENATLGKSVIIKSGTHIGQDGFGFITRKGNSLSIPHFGRVLIGDHTHIGSLVTIDRGSFGDTIIGQDCRIDNLIQIAHNVVIEDRVVMAAQCGISGSTRIGSDCLLGGQVGISGHVYLAPGTKVAAKSGVMRSTQPGEVVAGIPAGPMAQWRRRAVEERRKRS